MPSLAELRKLKIEELKKLQDVKSVPEEKKEIKIPIQKTPKKLPIITEDIEKRLETLEKAIIKDDTKKKWKEKLKLYLEALNYGHKKYEEYGFKNNHQFKLEAFRIIDEEL